MARWQPSAAALAASNAMPPVRYDIGAPFDPALCVTHYTPEAQRLVDAVRAAFNWATNIGGINGCSANRANHNTMNIHSIGRALDVMMPAGQIAGPDGEELANWAVINAPVFGIQLVIWNGTVWQPSLAPARRFAPYGGTNPHVDHVHLEVNTAGGAGTPRAPVPPTSGGPSILEAAAAAAAVWWLATRRSRR